MEKIVTFLNSSDLDITKTEIKESVNNSVDYIDKILPTIIRYGIKILIAILIFLIGKKLIKILIKIFQKSLDKSNLEISVSQFIVAVARVGLNVLLVIILVNILGADTSSFVAIVGSAGLTLGLALQGSLANFAGGVLILIAKPYKVGDYIIENTHKNEGTVTSIDIFYTRLLTIDNKMIVIPNGTLSNSSIINVTNEEVRRLDLFVSINYSENVEKVKEILTNLINEQELVLHDKEIFVYVNNFDPSAINLGIRAWVLQENYFTLKCELLEKIKHAFDENNIIIPYNHLDVNVINQ